MGFADLHALMPCFYHHGVRLSFLYFGFRDNVVILSWCVACCTDQDRPLLFCMHPKRGFRGKTCFRWISHVALYTLQRVGLEGFGDCGAEIIRVENTVSPVQNSILWFYMLFSCWNDVVNAFADIITVGETVCPRKNVLQS